MKSVGANFCPGWLKRDGDIARIRQAEMATGFTISEAIAQFTATLPGWWWSIGNCSVSADASCGPDRAGPDADLLAFRQFDEGFHCDAKHPASVQDSLMDVLRQAVKARDDIRNRNGTYTLDGQRCAE